MKIISEPTKIIYKILPLTFEQDGSVDVTINKCIEHSDGSFEPISSSVVYLSTEEVSAVLDVPPTPNLTRRQDIGLLLYQLLLDKGYVGTLDPEV